MDDVSQVFNLLSLSQNLFTFELLYIDIIQLEEEVIVLKIKQCQHFTVTHKFKYMYFTFVQFDGSM